MNGRTALRQARKVAATVFPGLHDVSYRFGGAGRPRSVAAEHFGRGGAVRVTARERLHGGEMRDLGYVSACLFNGALHWEAFDNIGKRIKDKRMR